MGLGYHKTGRNKKIYKKKVYFLLRLAIQITKTTMISLDCSHLPNMLLNVHTYICHRISTHCNYEQAILKYFLLQIPKSRQNRVLHYRS